MNIERLEKLADTIKSGIWVRPDGKVMAFNMRVMYSVNPRDVPVRADIPDRDIVSCCGCFIGFTVLMFCPRFSEEVLLDLNTGINWHIEAMEALELSEDQAFDLFYGAVSSVITGNEGYRVLRKLMLTEKPDWNMIHEDHCYAI